MACGLDGIFIDDFLFLEKFGVINVCNVLSLVVIVFFVIGEIVVGKVLSYLNFN